MWSSTHKNLCPVASGGRRTILSVCVGCREGGVRTEMAGLERYSWCVCKLSDVPSLDLCTRLAAGGQTNGWCREGYWVSLPSALPSIACRQLGPREEGGGGERQRARRSETEKAQRRQAYSAPQLFPHRHPQWRVWGKRQRPCMAEWLKPDQCAVVRASELCESRGGRPGLPSLISL